MNANGTTQTYAAEPVADATQQVVGTTERVAITLFHILEGAELSTSEVAELAGVTWDGAEKMLNKASRVVPITKYESRWRRFE